MTEVNNEDVRIENEDGEAGVQEAQQDAEPKRSASTGSKKGTGHAAKQRGTEALNQGAVLADAMALIGEMRGQIAEQSTQIDKLKDDVLAARKDARDDVYSEIARTDEHGRIAMQDAHEKVAEALAKRSRDETMSGPLTPVWLKVNVNIGEGKRNKVMKHERVFDADGRWTGSYVGEPVMLPLEMAKRLLAHNKADRADPLPGDE